MRATPAKDPMGKGHGAVLGRGEDSEVLPTPLLTDGGTQSMTANTILIHTLLQNQPGHL